MTDLNKESGEFLTQELLKALFLYDPESGIFIRRITTSNVAKKGSVAGYLTDSNYIEFMVLGNKYKAHRLAWLYMFGKFPDSQIDHVDQIKSNNRISNLRLTSNLQNSYNTCIRKDNTSGYKGVSLDKRCNRYRAYITINGKQKSLGYYDRAEEASEAYKIAAKELHGEFYNASTM